MNFTSIRRARFLALLSAVLVLGTEPLVAAPATKDSKAVTKSSKQVKKEKRSFAEQEKLLTPEQKKLWERFKSHPDFDMIIPEIKMKMDITKISQTSAFIIIPFETCESIESPDFPNSCRKLVFKSIRCSTGSLSAHGLSVAISFYLNNDNIVPEHDVPNFIKDHHDCYFYTPKAELEKLSDTEKEYIQAFDKALNTIYHNIYGHGFPKIDKKKLTKGEMGGWIYDVHKLYRRELDHKDIRFAHFLKVRSESELKFYDVLGWPLTMQDHVKASKIYPVSYMHVGGCEGEVYYSTDYTSQFAIPNGVDLSKNKKRLNKVLYQISLRCRGEVMLQSEQLDERIKVIEEQNLPNASAQFQKIIQNKVKTVRIYNKKLYSKASDFKGNKSLKSMAETGILDSYIKQNLALKVADEKKAPMTHNLGKQTTGSDVMRAKNTSSERGIE